MQPFEAAPPSELQQSQEEQNGRFGNSDDVWSWPAVRQHSGDDRRHAGHPHQQPRPAKVRVYVKAEFFNPAASVKDRLALSIIETAERSGELKPGQTVVEATSGNTGIGLAMVCAQKGYPLVVTMADSFSVERRRLMRMLGAKVVLTPRAQKGTGMYMKAAELAQKHGWFLARQFETAANADIHESTTAREIIGDFAGDRLDYVVTGYGTGGTVTGISRVLRRERPETQDHPRRTRQCRPDRQWGRAGAHAPMARRRKATRPSSRIPSRAGRLTSFPWCCRKPSTTPAMTSSFRSRGPMAWPGRKSSRRAKVSSPVSPAARPSPSP